MDQRDFAVRKASRKQARSKRSAKTLRPTTSELVMHEIIPPEVDNLIQAIGQFYSLRAVAKLSVTVGVTLNLPCMISACGLMATAS